MRTRQGRCLPLFQFEVKVNDLKLPAAARFRALCENGKWYVDFDGILTGKQPSTAACVWTEFDVPALGCVSVAGPLCGLFPQEIPVLPALRIRE